MFIALCSNPSKHLTHYCQSEFVKFEGNHVLLLLKALQWLPTPTGGTPKSPISHTRSCLHHLHSPHSLVSCFLRKLLSGHTESLSVCSFLFHTLMLFMVWNAFPYCHLQYPLRLLWLSSEIPLTSSFLTSACETGCSFICVLSEPYFIHNVKPGPGFS